MSLHDSITRLKGRGITGDKIDEYRAAWELFDTDGSGTVTTGKLGSLLNDTFGCSYSGEDLTYMLSQFGSSSEGRVDFFAFASTLHDRIGDPRYSEAWGDAFDLLDTSKMGELSKDDLQAGMLKLGETLTDAEADEMLKIAKKKDDFVRAMSNAVAATSSSAGGAGGAAPAVASGAAPTPGAGPVATPGRPGAPRPVGMAGPATPGARPGGPPAAPGGPGAAPGGPRPPRPGPAGSPTPGTPSAPRPPRAPGAN